MFTCVYLPCRRHSSTELLPSFCHSPSRDMLALCPLLAAQPEQLVYECKHFFMKSFTSSGSDIKCLTVRYAEGIKRGFGSLYLVFCSYVWPMLAVARKGQTASDTRPSGIPFILTIHPHNCRTRECFLFCHSGLRCNFEQISFQPSRTNVWGMAR